MGAVAIIGIRFLNASVDRSVIIDPTYDPVLVILSCIVAIVASYAALSLAERVAASEHRKHTFFWIALGGFAMGGGVWAMHFTGMLAQKMPVGMGAMQYDAVLTIASVIPAYLSSAVALWILSRSKLGWSHRIGGGVILGLGVGLMHYTGMSGMRISGVIYYDPLIFSLSIFIAIVLAIIALSVKFLPPTEFARKYRFVRMLSAPIIMGAAISGMHYTAMAATNIVPTDDIPYQPLGIDPFLLAGLTASAALAVLLIAILAASGESRAEASARLAKREKYLDTIVNTMVDGLVVIDEVGTVQSINRSALRIFGYSANEVVGKNINMLMTDEDHKMHDNYMAGYLTGGEAKIIGQTARWVPGRHKNGDAIDLELAIGEVINGDERLFVGSVRDITERRRDRNALIREKEKAESANRTKSSFLTNMSHELRTPLNAIIGFSQIMMEKGGGFSDEEAFSEYPKIIHESGQHLLELVSGILEVSKMESGEAELNEEDVDIAEIVSSVVDMVRARACEGEVTLYVDVAPDAPLMLADSLKLKQILINLVSNAVKFTEPCGHVSINVQYSDGRGYTFQVSDTGIGISPEDIPKALAAFQQVEGGYARAHEGTGLGLFLAKSLAEMHGGTLVLESEKGKGTKVVVQFPARRAERKAS